MSFAWCHDEEKINILMSPELSCEDMTFGLSKKRRNLVLFAGIDGTKKSFTVFRCWMPSKQNVAYEWAICVALPLNVGKKVTMRTRFIASDAENALVDVLNNTILSPKGVFRNAKYSKDYYYLVKQPWNKLIGVCKNDMSHPSFSIYSTVVYNWIKS